jgi:hypothetical protein
MQAVILHAEGDQPLAAGVADRLAPASAAFAPLSADSGADHADSLALFSIWSARADAQGLGQALSRLASRADGRAVVVRADGTPLPPLPPGTRLLTVSDGPGTFAHALGFAQSRVRPTAAQTRPARARAVIGGWTPGVSLGLAIYAGMFVVAGAWRSEEVNEAIANGQAAPIAGALQSFNVAAMAGASQIQVALAPSSLPTAGFVQPQRVVLTGTLDTTNIPVVAEAPRFRTADETIPAPIRLHPIDASLKLPGGYGESADVAPIGALAALDLIPQTPSLDVGSNQF